MPRKKVPTQLITIDRGSLDDAIFNGVQQMIDDAALPLPHRTKLRMADRITEGVMTLVDAESVSVRKVAPKKNSGGIPPKPLPPASSGIEPALHKQ